ncbi:RNA-binding protein 25-like [Atheta coriaria]|uniref:RNA-binding protein 25-like n=1 Tax=Dalotia coriaria TaxID=877792 RepID=UPI0031F3F6F8
MTRFARAKGSKASNERVAEEATSWAEMKHQLNEKKEEVEHQKKQKEADLKRKNNYDNFIKEVEKEEAKKSEWADFPGTLIVQKKKANQKVLANKKDNVVKATASKPTEVDEVDKVDDGMEVPKNNNKKRKLNAKEDSSTKNTNKNNKSKKLKKNEVVVPIKKTVEEMSEEERRKFEKKKDKKVKQLEKRKIKKQQMKEQKEANNNVQKPQNTKLSPKVKKFDSNKEHKRRKPVEEVQKLNINGKEIDVVLYDGFPIKREDADRLHALRKQMISKGLPRSEVNMAMKLERRRAEKALTRDKKNVCYNCRQSGHVLSECPAIAADGNMDTAASGICFKCGSTEHTAFACKVVKSQEFRFASCFICKEQGHISWQCPDNARGLYPKGGGCKLCGDVTHLKKDCPKHVAEQEAGAISLPTLTDSNPDALEFQTTGSVASGGPKANKIKQVKF